jgi:uncharacterized protein (TIGR02453 family)
VTKPFKPLPFFTPRTTAFLKGLRAHNSKAWFEPHRHEYETDLLEPLKRLAAELAPLMVSLDVSFEVTPAKTISRIYRDIRFTKDKSPYRDNAWLTWKGSSQEWQDRPVFFFEITPELYRWGMGFYNASRPTMDKIRHRMETHPLEWIQYLSIFYKLGITVEGEDYKKALPGKIPEKLRPWFQKKNFYLPATHKINPKLFSFGLADEIIEAFSELAPVYQALWKIIKS